MHIGLIGGIGPAATVFYYERIVAALSDRSESLSLTIAHTSARTLTANVSADKREEQAEEFRRVTQQLANAGATTVAVTSMGGHFCSREFAAVSPLPLIDGPGAVGRKLTESGIRRVGILGTRIVMKTGLYGALKSLETVIPAEQALTQANDDYVAMAVAGTATDEQRGRLLQAGHDLVHNQGAEAILLGGTDLNLVFTESAVNYPIIDSAVIHVNEIVQRIRTADR